jgi:hypothetical protein
MVIVLLVAEEELQGAAGVITQVIRFPLARVVEE